MTDNSGKDNEDLHPGPSGSGEPGTVRVPGKAGKPITPRKSPVPRLVERVTALRGLSISRPQEPKSTCRRQTQLDIYAKDAEIPYVKFEAAFRDLVCSLMERQDRMNEAIFYKINDLGYRLEDLEEDRAASGGAR